MKLNPTPPQTFLVLSMLLGETLEEREPKLSDRVVRALKPAQVRKDLEHAGLIKVEKRGRSSHVVLEDAAWDFAAEHLAADLPQTAAAAKVLQRVLGKLQRFLHTHEHSLAEFVGGDAASAASSAEFGAAQKSTSPAETVESTEQAVRTACLALAHNETRKRIRLKDLRERVPASKEFLDQTLRGMQAAGQLVLYKLDNPAEISPEDERAALFIAGEPRHLVYLEA